jgi:hypothetical protein
MAAHGDRPRIAHTFDRSHIGRLLNAMVDRIYRAAFGDDYSEAAQPSAFYITHHPAAPGGGPYLFVAARHRLTEFR